MEMRNERTDEALDYFVETAAEVSIDRYHNHHKSTLLDSGIQPS